MQVIVIGCGLAGLTVAIALAKGGHTVVMLESAAEITYIGAGIQISPNSSKVLRKLGIDKYILKHTTEPVDLKMMRWKDGQVLVECPLKQPADDDYKSPYWHIHRADFHRGLVQCATDLGIVVHLDSKVVRIEPENATVFTAGGKSYSGDLIVASDGLNSMAREIVHGKPGPPVPTGQMVYRITLPAKGLEGIAELKDIVTVPRNNHWIGPNGTILSYLLEGVNEKLVNLVLTCDVRMPDGVNQKPGNIQEVRERFKEWDPRIDKVLEHASTVLEWRLFTHEQLPSWIHPSSKLCLIGDAAHAMTPYLAQGAAMGIEDSAILGGVLAKYPSPSTLPKALSLYEKLRMERTARITRASIDSRYFTQMPDGEKQRERDAFLLSHPGIWEGHINIRSDKAFLDGLFGYDAYAELEAVGL